LTPKLHEVNRTDGFFIRKLPDRIHSYSLSEVYPPAQWNQQSRFFQWDQRITTNVLGSRGRAVGALLYKDESGTGFALTLGIFIDHHKEVTARLGISQDPRHKRLEDTVSHASFHWSDGSRKEDTYVLDYIAGSLAGGCAHITKEIVLGQKVNVVDIGIPERTCLHRHDCLYPTRSTMLDGVLYSKIDEGA
jgi:hypothetical protein